MEGDSRQESAKHLFLANQTSIKTLELRKSKFSNSKSDKTLTFCNNCKNNFTASLSPRNGDSNFSFQQLQESKKPWKKSIIFYPTDPPVSESQSKVTLNLENSVIQEEYSNEMEK